MDRISQNNPQVNQKSTRVDFHPQDRVERLNQLNGLVTGAISAHGPKAVRLEFKAGGMTAKRTLYASPPQSNGRGVVAGMSKKSRRRLMDKLIGIDWRSIIPQHGKSNRAVLLTLTYPSEYSDDWQEHKLQLKAFRMRLERTYPIDGVLWRLEFQRRGAPHYHLVVVFGRDVNIARFRRWVSLAWYMVVGSQDPRHLRAGTNVRRLYGPTGKLMRYLSKYVSKRDSGPARQTGRVWGVWGELPEGETLVIELNWERWVEFTRRLRKWGKGSRYVSRLTAKRRGFLVFGDCTQLLRGLWQLEPVT